MLRATEQSYKLLLLCLQFLNKLLLLSRLEFLSVLLLLLELLSMLLLLLLELLSMLLLLLLELLNKLLLRQPELPELRLEVRLMAGLVIYWFKWQLLLKHRGLGCMNCISWRCYQCCIFAFGRNTGYSNFSAMLLKDDGVLC